MAESAWARWRAEESARLDAERRLAARRARSAAIDAAMDSSLGEDADPVRAAKAAVREAERIARRWERLRGAEECAPDYRAAVARGLALADGRRRSGDGSD